MLCNLYALSSTHTLYTACTYTALYLNQLREDKLWLVFIPFFLWRRNSWRVLRCIGRAELDGEWGRIALRCQQKDRHRLSRHLSHSRSCAEGFTQTAVTKDICLKMVIFYRSRPKKAIRKVRQKFLACYLDQKVNLSWEFLGEGRMGRISLADINLTSEMMTRLEKSSVSLDGGR